MDVATELWERHVSDSGASVRPTVVFTTEAKSMMEEQQAWVQDMNRSSQSTFEFQFMTNSRDILPGSGFMKDIGTFANHTITAPSSSTSSDH